MTTQDILSKLNDQQKASLICGAGFFSKTEISEYGIKRMQFLDGSTGMKHEQMF